MLRDNRKNKEYFDTWIDYDRQRVATMKKAVDDFPEELNPRQLLYMHNYANKHLQILAYRFSRGDELRDLEGDVDAAVTAFNVFNRARNSSVESTDAYPLDIDRSQQAIWLAYFALCSYERGSKLDIAIRTALMTPDKLLNEVSGIVMGEKVLTASDCVAQKVHEPLLGFCMTRAIDDNEMIRFVSTWYDKCDNAYWHDTHEGDDRGYFGYWCFEAALVSKALGHSENPFYSSIYYPKW